MVIPFVVTEILGGWNHPQMALSCQKRQMPLTVKNDTDMAGKSQIQIYFLRLQKDGAEYFSYIQAIYPKMLPVTYEIVSYSSPAFYISSYPERTTKG